MLICKESSWHREGVADDKKLFIVLLGIPAGIIGFESARQSRRKWVLERAIASPRICKR